MRILHFSDPHLYLSLKDIPFKDWFNKRAIGALNFLVRRSNQFKQSREKIELLYKFKEQNSVDLVICTGDFTILGLEKEMMEASKLMESLIKYKERFITVPGNHDLYLDDSLKSGRFNRYFGKFMGSDISDYRVDEVFPFVRIFDEVAIVGVNSSKPNPTPWSSNGYIPDKQLNALEKILKDGRVKDKTIFIITHYAPRNHKGEPDSKNHRLVNANQFLNVCKGVKNGAILTGHIHKPFKLSLKSECLNIPLFCAGSVTMESRESFWLFDIEDGFIKASKGFFRDGEYKTE